MIPRSAVDALARVSYHARMKSPAHILARLKHRVSEALRRRRFAASVTHEHGPTTLDAAPQDVVLIALVRNGSYYLDAFFDYYRGLGVQHFVFFDNGSTDDTLARIRQEPGTIIDRSPLPLAGYEDLIRQYPAQTYGENRWCLYVDMDEIFDFEGRAEIGLQGLITYLEAEGHTALPAQMLEMFPKGGLNAAAKLPFDEALAAFSYFDISTVKRYDYHSDEIEFSALLKDNTLSSEAIKFCFGGVRGKVFGENCCLTKHPLIFNGPGVTPAPHPHLSMGVRVADISAVIKHYKFANDPKRRDMSSVLSGDLDHGEDAKRAAVLNAVEDVSLFSVDARPWNRVALLIRSGFLVSSDRYAAFLGRDPQ